MTVFRIIISIQASYILITAVWPILHIQSFMDVTGPKHDVWLVKTVGALLIPISITLYSFLFFKADPRPAVLLGALTAAAFVAVDFYFALTDVISNIYLLDGVAELILLAAWIYVATNEVHYQKSAD